MVLRIGPWCSDEGRGAHIGPWYSGQDHGAQKGRGVQMRTMVLGRAPSSAIIKLLYRHARRQQATPSISPPARWFQLQRRCTSTHWYDMADCAAQLCWILHIVLSHLTFSWHCFITSHILIVLFYHISHSPWTPTDLPRPCIQRRTRGRLCLRRLLVCAADRT